MIEQEMARLSHDIMGKVMGVQPDEEVVVVTDAEKVDLARAIAAASRSIGAFTSIVVKPRMDNHSQELPETVAAPVKAADVIADTCTYAISHTKARQEATAAGARHLVLRGVTTDMMVDGSVSTDFEEIQKWTDAVATIQSRAETARTTCTNGTDLTVDLEGRDSMYKDWTVGVAGPGDIALLPAGKAAIAPIEGTAQGKIVFDYSFDNLGIVDEPIETIVQDGFVTDIDGGRDARKLEELLEEKGKNARNIAEAPSLGTNPDLGLVGNLAIDKKVIGTAHFALGDNRTLGGDISSDVHLDGLVSKPTVTFDGEVVIEDGHFQFERVEALAAELSD